MKYHHLTLILLATIGLYGCGQKQITTTNQDPNAPKYYAHNPEDTIGNEPYWLLLRIDSARVAFRMDRPVSEMPTINLDSSGGAEKTTEQQQHDDSVVIAETEAKWFELMRLCSQRQYEDALCFYIKEQTDIGIALATSTNKFALDYYVIGPLLFDQLDEEEAAEIMVKFLDYDKFLTESVILLGESPQGYVPSQYAFQLEILRDVYLMQNEWGKAEALIEPYRKAVYLLSDDTLSNEIAITDFKFQLYGNMGDKESIKEAFEEYRTFLIQYAKDTHQDLDEQIEQLNTMIKKVVE